MYEYSSLSDTAKVVSNAALPEDQLLNGWMFYANNLKVSSIPDDLGDTLIDNVSFKKVRFHYNKQDSTSYYTIGYLRCDGHGSLLSLEKDYSTKTNCTMTTIFSYDARYPVPYGSQEIKYISDSLSIAEQKVFDTWNKKALEEK